VIVRGIVRVSSQSVGICAQRLLLSSFYFDRFRSRLDSGVHPAGANAIVCQLKVDMSAISPNAMTAAARLDEIADILAAGLMRVRARQSTPQSADLGDSSLDCPADQSGHADVLNGGGK
jgi:hypothetical protein